MSMATTRNIRRGIWVLWVVLLLVPAAQVHAVGVAETLGPDP